MCFDVFCVVEVEFFSAVSTGVEWLWVFDTFFAVGAFVPSSCASNICSFEGSFAFWADQVVVDFEVGKGVYVAAGNVFDEGVPYYLWRAARGAGISG